MESHSRVTEVRLLPRAAFHLLHPPGRIGRCSAPTSTIGAQEYGGNGTYYVCTCIRSPKPLRNWATQVLRYSVLRRMVVELTVDASRRSPAPPHEPYEVPELHETLYLYQFIRSWFHQALESTTEWHDITSCCNCYHSTGHCRPFIKVLHSSSSIIVR
jgi:hypothetical protein